MIIKMLFSLKKKIFKMLLFFFKKIITYRKNSQTDIPTQLENIL